MIRVVFWLVCFIFALLLVVYNLFGNTLFLKVYPYFPLDFRLQIVKEIPSRTNRLTALFYATYFDDAEAVRELLKNNLELSNVRNDEGYMAFHQSATHGSIEVVRSFVENGVDVDMRSEKGDTALILALIFERLDVSEYLIEKGAKVNVQGDNGNTPLHIAVVSGRQGLVEVILNQNPNITLKNERSRTAVEVACRENKSVLAKLIVGSDPCSISSKVSSCSDYAERRPSSLCAFR